MKKISKEKTLPRIAVFCSGFGSNFQAILDAVRSKKLRTEIVLMVSDSTRAFAIRRAKKAQVPVVVLNPKLFASRENYEKVIVEILRNQSVNLVVLAGFMRILTPYFIKAYQGRILNIHPSYLPNFKGAHAIRDAFEAGVSETGVTVHFVNEKVDSGRVIVQEKVKVLSKDTLASLEARIHRVEHRLYPQGIRQVIDSKIRKLK